MFNNVFFFFFLSLEVLFLKIINHPEVKVHQPFNPITMGG